MGTWFGGMGELIAALMSGDMFELSFVLRTNLSVWPLGLIILLVGAVLILLIYRALPMLERYLEPSIMVASYLLMGGIIFAGVIQRFYLNGQPPWSTTVPPLLFLIMAWLGCSYNVKLRTHLAFSEFRMSMPRSMQMMCLTLDALLWIGFAWIVMVTGFKVTINSIANFQIVPGTDDLKQWWFLTTLPISFMFLTSRAIENLLADLKNYKSGETLIGQAVIGEG